MADTPPANEPKTLNLDVGYLRELAQDALIETEPLGGIRSYLLDLADPRVTPGLPDQLREQARELAGELERADEAISDRLETIENEITRAIDGADDA